MVEVKPAGRPAGALDDQVLRGGIVCAVVGVLRSSLHAAKLLFLRVGPIGEGEFVNASAGVNREEKIAISVRRRAESQIPLVHEPSNPKTAGLSTGRVNT